MSDICKINVSILKSYEKDFKSELNNFNNKTYTTFSSSYLKNCSDAHVRRMSNELQTLYDKVKKGYQNIDKWWVDYNANVEGLENYLSDNGSAGAISESSIRNSVNQLPSLKKYNLKFAGIIPASIVGTSYNAAFANNAVVSAVDPFSSLYSDYRVSEVNASKVVNNDNVVDQIDEAISTASASVVSWAKNIGSNIKNFLVSTGAKISSFGETVVSKASEVIEDVDNFFDETKAYVANKAESLWDKTTEWWNDTTQKVDSWFDEVGTNISNGAKSLWADVTDWWSDVEDWWNDDAIPWIENAANAVWDVVKSVGATVAVFVQSLVEGILQFGEAIIDFVALVGTSVASIVTGLIDGGQAIYGAITGNEWSSVTKQMWGGTMGFVSKQYVSGWFDLLYQNTGYGQWLAENAYGFDITRSIGSGIGYIAGVVVLTIATFGAGSVVAAGGSVTASTAAAATTTTQMAVTATAAGIGRGTQNAWADGAELLEGLTAGTLTGLWEGLQFYVGGKISGLNIFGADGILKSIGSSRIGTKLLNGLARVVLDGADGGVEGFVLPLINSIYKDGYYDDNGNYIYFTEQDGFFERYLEGFDDNGGWSAVWTNAGIGAGSSLLGETFDLSKYFKNSKNTDIELSPEIKGVITELDDAYSARQLDDIIDSLISKDKGANGRIAGGELFRKLDYDSVPRLVTPDEFLKLSNDSSYGIIYRGISGEDSIKYMDQFKNGEMYVGGGNAHVKGTGIYTAYGDTAYEKIAQVYASNGGTTQNGIVMNMLLSEDAKIIGFDTLQAEQWEVLDGMSKSFNKYDSVITNFDTLASNLDKITDPIDLKKAQYIVNTLANPGYYAALRGFDAIDVVDKKYLVICNRGKIIMQADTTLDYIRHVDDFSNAGVNFDDVLSLKTDELSITLKNLDDSTLGKLITHVNDIDNLKYILGNVDETKLVNIISKLDDVNISKITSSMDSTQLMMLLSRNDIDDVTYRSIVNSLGIEQLIQSGQYIRGFKGMLDVKIGSNGASKMISTSWLFDIIKEDSIFALFVSDFDNNTALFRGLSKGEIANGLKQIDDMMKNNGYNFKYDRIQQLRIEIVNQYYMSPRMVDLNIWGDTIMTSNFRRLFPSYVTDTQLSALSGTYRFLEPDDFAKATTNPKAMAFNNGVESVMNLDYPDDIIRSNISHESLHQISSKPTYYDPVSGFSISKVGLELNTWDPNVGSWTSKYEGINETVTEFLNELAMGKDYPTTEYSGYQPAVRRLKQILNMNIEGFDSELIKKAYIDSDVSPIASAIDKIASPNFFEDKFIPAFDEAIKGNLSKLDKIILVLKLLSS